MKSKGNMLPARTWILSEYPHLTMRKPTQAGKRFYVSVLRLALYCQGARSHSVAIGPFRKLCPASIAREAEIQRHGPIDKKLGKTRHAMETGFSLASIACLVLFTHLAEQYKTDAALS